MPSQPVIRQSNPAALTRSESGNEIRSPDRCDIKFKADIARMLVRIAVASPLWKKKRMLPGTVPGS
jgi:hypothetical protein